MKIDQENFAQLVNRAMQNSRVAHMRPVIAKELLHCDTLFALDKGHADKSISTIVRVSL